MKTQNDTVTVTITYNASARTFAGFRQVEVTAMAEKISAKRVQVKEVIMIDGEFPSYGMSITGSKRQEYNGLKLAEIEAGKKKNISSLIDIN